MLQLSCTHAKVITQAKLLLQVEQYPANLFTQARLDIPDESLPIQAGLLVQAKLGIRARL